MRELAATPEAGAVFILATLGLLGSIFQAPILRSLIPGANEMNPLAAAGCALGALTLIRPLESNRVGGWAALGMLFVGVISLLPEVAHNAFSFEMVWVEPLAEPVPVSTAICFLGLGGARLLTTKQSRLASLVVRFLLLLVGIIALEVLIGYLFASTSDASLALLTPMALPTALSFALLTFGAARSREMEWPMSLIRSRSAAGLAARLLIPAAVAIVLIAGWLRLWGQKVGLYGTEAGTALYAVVSILALTALTLYITGKAHRMEAARANDQENLRRAFAAQDVLSTTRREMVSVAHAIVDQGRRLTDAAGAALAILEQGRIIYRVGEGSARVLEGLEVDASRSMAGRVLNESAPEILRPDDGELEAEIRERMGDVSVAVVSLASSEGPRGVLLVFSRPGQRFEMAQVQLLCVIRSAAAEALAQAHEFDTRQELLRDQAGELEMLQEQFAAFMSRNAAASFIKDRAGRYIFANAAVSRFLGADAEEVLARRDEDILSDVELGALRTPLTPPSREAGHIVQFRRNGIDEFWLLQEFDIRTRDERVFRAGIAVDISEQKRAEERVAEVNRTLEERVAERTTELKEANEELESFSYSVSHDLRAPLRAVTGYSRLLARDHAAALDDEGLRFLSTITSEAMRMGTLIDDLLTFARIGRQSMSRGHLDMAAMAEEVILDIRKEWPDRHIDLMCEPLPWVFGDRALLRQVLVNLLSNATKYAKPDGHVQIEITATVSEDLVTFHVRDRGVGFDMRYADKLFGVFQRLHSMEEFEGTGVGLAIVKRIITRHGGAVGAVGARGEGADFFFTLPHAGEPVEDGGFPVSKTSYESDERGFIE